MRLGQLIIGLIILGVGCLMLYGAYGLATNGTDYHYEYTVKAEQVNEDEMVNESIAYENVSDAEQEVLFDAFKKSDHFLGGAEAYVHTDEPIENISNEWRVIEIQGVPMLVAIEGPEHQLEPHESTERLAVSLGVAFGLLLTLWGLGGIIVGLDD